MKSSRLTLIGAAATVLALTTSSVLAGEHETRTIQGKIMTLNEYFGVGNTAGASSAAYSHETSGADATRALRDNHNNNSTAPRSTTGLNDASQSARGATPGSTATASGARPGARQAGDDKAGLGTSNDRGSWNGETLVLVVSSTSASASSATSASATGNVKPQRDTSNPLTQGSTRDTTAHAATSAIGGQAYVLVCDAQNQSKLSGLTFSQMDNSAGLGAKGRTDVTSGTASGQQGRSDYRSDGSKSDANSGEKRNPAQSYERSTSTTDSGVAGKSLSGEVKVTGKVLMRGGIQAIQVASVEKADGSGIDKDRAGQSDNQSRSTASVEKND